MLPLKVQVQSDEAASPVWRKLSCNSDRILSGQQNSCWITKKEYTRVRLLMDMDLSDPTRILTEKLLEYMKEIREDPPNSWFHRKSYRLVLSMLRIKNPNTDNYEFIRGINSEISLPTGSICAERAAIAAARSRFPSLKRRHFYGIAVIDFPLFDDHQQPMRPLLNPLGPCGACREYLYKFQEKSENFRVVTYSDIDCTEVHERFLFISQVTRESEPKWLLQFWKCFQCSTMNEPKRTECQHCERRRFTVESLQPLERTILSIMDRNRNRLPIEEIRKIGKRRWPGVLLGRKLDALIQNQFVECTESKGSRYYKLTSQGLEVASEMKQQWKTGFPSPPSTASNLGSPKFRSVSADLEGQNRLPKRQTDSG